MRFKLLGVVVCACWFVTWGQAKRPLTFADYDSWKSIQSQAISDDGKWVAYALMPQVGDGEAIVRELASGKETRIPIGTMPVRTPEPGDEAGEGPPPGPSGPKISFSPDGQYVVVQTFARKADVDAARRSKKKAEEMPKGGLAIVTLATGAVVNVADVRTFDVPAEGRAVLAFASGKRVGLRAMGDGASTMFEGASDFVLNRDGSLLAATGAEEAIIVNTSTGTKTVLKSGKARYGRPVFDFDGKRLAFTVDGALWGWEGGKTEEWAKGPVAGAPLFTRDGKKIAFTVTSKPRRDTPADPAEEKAVFEMWHWKDDRVQTIQKARAAQDRNRGTRILLHLADKRTVNLGDADVTEVTLSDNGMSAIGFGDRSYAALTEYDTRYRDVWIVNPENGERRVASQKITGMPVLSPDGKYAAYYHARYWWIINLETGTTTNLTAHAGEKFANELADTPGLPGSYGQVGWTSDSGWFLVHSRYDVWALKADASEARNVTEGTGRKQKLIFRVARPRIDPRERGIDPGQPLLLRAESEDTRESGFYRDPFLAAGEPVKLTMQARSLSAPRMARKADVMLLTGSRFEEFPDLLVTDSSFSKFEKISDANPQKKAFLWGTAELAPFRSPDGAPLNSILYKPEGFDPAKKYPLIVYIYERLSEGLHSFVQPEPAQNVNRSLYVSNGYLMLYPDIAYTNGYPGESALKCVAAAVQKVVDMGIVDEKRIGIQGHSWGGYQIAYMVTRTNRFAAAAPGALVANMTSAYDGIRYGPGMPRQFQYEKGQSRIGGSLWQYPMRYLDNSPIFRADRVETPLLMLHNDADTAVPYTQGIEFFLALRRLGKEVYFFNYNGEPHGLQKRTNKRDYAMRQYQFFDALLRGAPRPEWMTKGIPYSERSWPERQAWQPAASDQTAKNPGQ